MSTPDLIATAEQLDQRARALLDEAVAVADTYERIAWEDAVLDVRDAYEGTPDERRFFEAMHDVSDIIAVVRLKFTEAMSAWPLPEHIEDKFPDLPEYRRLYEQHNAQVRHWIDLGKQLGRAE